MKRPSDGSPLEARRRLGSDDSSAAHPLHASTLSLDDNVQNHPRTDSNESSGGSARPPSVIMMRQSSHSSSQGLNTNNATGKRNFSTRAKKSRPESGSSAASSTFDPRGSVLSRLSSTAGANLRDTFFGGATKRHDPLELSTNQEFDLTVIDESGGMEENIVGQILSPDVGLGSGPWSGAGYLVVGIGFVTLVVCATLAVSIKKLDGYDLEPGLVFGSFQTLLLCTIVFVTYNGVQSFQAHPNPLILYKCVIDMILALRFLLDPLLQTWNVYTRDDPSSCKYLSGVTQFLYLASDSWYFALIVDLYTSLTNPFTSVKADRTKYKIAIYAVSTFSGLMTAVIPQLHGISDGSYCWTDRGGKDGERNFWRLNTANWLLFYAWMIVYYLSGIAVLTFGAKRLRSGLRDTLQTRRDMLRNGAISIMSFTAYWTIVFTWYAVSFHTRTHYEAQNENRISPKIRPSKIFNAFSYSLTGRGAVDYFVWFMLNQPSLMKANWLRFSTESADKKFSAQLNTALQHELIYFTIEGMTRALQMADEELLYSRDRSPTQGLELGGNDDDERYRKSSTPPVLGDPRESQQSVASAATGINLQDLGTESSKKKSNRKYTNDEGATFEIPQRTTSPTSKSAAKNVKNPSAPVSPALRSPAKMASKSSYNHIRFTPYQPEAFAELRSAYGITAQDFVKSFETSTKPNISEGASGAFMFFSGDKRFIVKSMAEAECRFLCEIAEDYVEYLVAHPSSLITKFFGCFKITMYEKKFYFVVMENLFDVAEQGVQIHHRFDIKGSWVNRSYKRPRKGAKVKCRHCSMQFKYGAKKVLLQCPNVVGLHEPNVVLKDNDLRTRMRIGRQAGKELYELLRDDSLFLCSLGIMDYSLLLGVVDIEFMVDQPTGHKTGRRNTVTSNPDGKNESFMTTDSLSSHDNGDDQEIGTVNPLSSLVHGNDDRARIDSSDDPLGHSVRSLADHAHQPRAKKTMRRSKRIFGPGYYYVGVIDILQTWTLQKKLERFWKVNFQRCDADGLSAIDPVQYQKRFEAKLREIIALPKEYVAGLGKRRFTAHSFGGAAMGESHRGTTSRFISSRDAASSMLERGGAGTVYGAETKYDDGNDDDMEVGGHRSTPQLAELESSSTSHTNSSGEDLEDLEQANRNPEPILLHFSQMLVGSSQRSNLTALSSAHGRDTA
uniref:PIPK domain-containing protein n=1 Tax=Globisporangium ultimum (strain ATCC 200006 / CBS 805.95 / DAOM BR144) TaxID=431595 RepID=K3WT33_GLOUD